MLPVPSPIDRALLARSVDRIEIISPRSADARDDSPRVGRRRDDWSIAWRDAQGREHEAARPSPAMRFASPRFAAQRMAQEGFGPGAHLENWRGAARAYARAQSLGSPGTSAGEAPAPGISILV
ncbi:MAG: hypothetical protein JNK67_11635 [Alphaproteobacteria bacterium]|nr:hypothetical protein [Alphaproteobacteria bacterium]